MKKFLFLAILAVSFVAAIGCGKPEIETVQPQAAAPKGSFGDAIKNNPNMPEAAKKALLGNQQGK